MVQLQAFHIDIASGAFLPLIMIRKMCQMT